MCVSSKYLVQPIKRLVKTPAHTHLIQVFISPILSNFLCGVDLLILRGVEQNWVKMLAVINESGEEMTSEMLSFQ